MNETIDKLIFALDGDLAPLQGKFAQADQAASNTGKKIADSIGKPVQEAAKQSGDAVTTNIDRGFKEAAAAASAHSKKIADEVGKIAPAVVAGQQAVQKSVKLTSAEITNLTYQLNDVIGGLAMGQRPMQVLLQQGGQFVQIFQRTGIKGLVGGIGNALAALVSPGVAAGLAVGGIGIAAVTAAYQAESAAIRIRNALASTGYASGATQDDLIRASQGLVAQGRYSTTGAQDVLGIAASRGTIPSSLFQQFGAAATGLSRAVPGTSQADAATKLEDLLTNPANAAKELNEQFKLLDVAQTKQIDRLTAQGRTYDAQKLILEAVNSRFKNLEEGAWSLSKTFGAIGRGFSNFWNNTGNLLAGEGKTKAQQVAELQAYNAMTLRTLAAGGIADPRATLAAHPGQGINVGGGIRPLATIMADFDDRQRQITALQKEMAADVARTRAGELRNQANSAIGAGLADVDKGAGAFNTTLRNLQDTLNRDQLAVRKATETNSQYTEVLTKQRDAVKIALEATQKYGSPEAQAAQRAADARRLAGASLDNKGLVAAQIQAEERRRQNLMNPATALQAQGIYASDMAAARFNSRDNNRDAEKAEQQRKNLAAMKAEADQAEDMARAYDMGAAAVERARIAGEAHTAFVKEEIKDEKAYADALQRRAFAQAAAAVAQRRIDDSLSLEGLRRTAGAGGSAAGISSANSQTAAIAATAKEFAAASTMEQHMRAYADYQKALATEEEKAALNREVASNKTTVGLEQNIEMQRLLLRLKYEDAELRAKEIAQLETIQELSNEGYQKGTAEYDAEYKRRSALKETAGALGAEGDTKSNQIYTAFREGLGSVLMAGTEGFKNMGDAASNFLKQLAQMTLQMYVFAPLLNILLGKGSTPGGGLLGSLFSGLGGLFGGGKASGGFVDPGKFYVVGENGPEILGGVGGHITPMSPPRGAGDMGGANMNGPTQMNFALTVNGQGDKDILRQADAVATAAVQKGIAANNKLAKRTMRGNLINQNKRALS